MNKIKRFKFRFIGLSLTAPSNWHKPDLLKRILYPSRPELFGPSGPAYEFLWFEKPIAHVKIPTFSEMSNHLTGTVQVRGNRILSRGMIAINNKDYPTITFEKIREGFPPTTMKRYFIIHNNKSITLGVRLTRDNIACYPEEEYDKIIQSLKKI